MQQPLSFTEPPDFWRGTSDFLSRYELNLTHEFQYGGQAAQWAPGHDGPRFWGEQDGIIHLNYSQARMNDYGTYYTTAAVSPDDRFLAVSTGNTVRIYNLDSLDVCAEWVGHEYPIDQLHFASRGEGLPGDDGSVKYRLMSQGMGGKLAVWDVEPDGRLSRDMIREPFAIDDLAERAIQSISHDLRTHHHLSPADLEPIRTDFLYTLARADVRNQVAAAHALDGRSLQFGGSPISRDGTKTLLIEETWPSGGNMYPPKVYSELVIRDVASLQEVTRTQIHDEYLAWAGWSLDDKFIVTASWDETYKFWNVETGECVRTIARTGGQVCAGMFLPDGEHVVLSRRTPATLGVYAIATGEMVAQLPSDGGRAFENWSRCFTVHPVSGLVVVQRSAALFAWDPLRGRASSPPSSQDDVQQIFGFAVKNEHEAAYVQIDDLEWDREGARLAARGSDRTLFVWDINKQLKWRFQRPQGREVEHGSFVFFIKRHGEDWIASLDGDGAVRLWKL